MSVLDGLLRREATDQWCSPLVADRGVWAQVKATERMLGCSTAGSRSERYLRVTGQLAQLRKRALTARPSTSAVDGVLAGGAWRRVERQAQLLTDAERAYFARASR